MISKMQYNIYFFSVLFIYISYLLLLLGISIINIQYLHILVVITHVTICFFLFMRFNIFSNDTLTINQYEKNIIFSSAFLLFINTLIYEIGLNLNVNAVRTFLFEKMGLSKIFPIVVPVVDEPKIVQNNTSIH